MYLTDYHSHTTISSDSQNSIYTLCKMAENAGIREICTTDHWNLVNQQGVPQPIFDWKESLKQHKALKTRFLGRLELRLGLEVGNGLLDEEAVKTVLSLPELDFIIGSLHNMSQKHGNIGSFTAAHRVTSLEEAKAILEDYMDLLEALAASDGYDVLGHIIYPLRYLPKEYGLTLEPWWDRLSEVFKTVIAKGKGIEVNTSSGATIADWVPYLKLYKSLGGEVLTFGSDTHRPDTVGKGIDQCYALAREAGFKWVTTYKHRVPFFTAL